ncbi:hypothetical protein K438DRAFT_1749331 [Mycena galopus ATCC 62051]|nr:hypothetical protein K438DRAFT_1749331 [Mycena galopus ATCC 62051]
MLGSSLEPEAKGWEDIKEGALKKLCLLKSRSHAKGNVRIIPGPDRKLYFGFSWYAIGAIQWLILIASSGGSARQKYPRMAGRAIGIKFSTVEPSGYATQISHWMASMGAPQTL